MTMIQAAVIGIVAVVLAVQLKTLRGEFSVYLILAAALIIGFLGISRLELIVETARELASKEGLMCGISSGTNVAVAKRMARKLGKGKTVVTILADTAERYFSTPLFEE